MIYKSKMLKFKSHAFRNLLMLLGAVFLFQCSTDTKIQEQFSQRVKQIGSQKIADRALDVFEAGLKKEGSKWQLTGETTVPGAYEAVVALADSLLGNNKYDNQLMQLPDAALGDSAFAIVKVSVTQLRDEPRHAAQIIDQTIMGRNLNLLRYERGWYLVQTDYDYVGWVDFTALHRTDAAGVRSWNDAADLIVSGLYPMVYSKPDDASEPVADVVLNARLRPVGRSGKWMQVATPDGREGYILAENVKNIAEIPTGLPSEKLRPQLISTARRMMGVPYLWGGNSSKGNDCSGFTQTVFKTNGMQLPRDSRQQALEGIEIKPDENWSNVLPGDLLFFGNGKRVTHVGISLGGKEFIHQGGRVAVNSLDPASPVFSPYRSKSIMFVRRVVE